MFETAHIPVLFADIRHRQLERDDQEIGLVEVTCQIAPFAADLAGELDDTVKRILFGMRDVAVNQKVRSVAFELGVRPQLIRVSAAPDTEASFIIDEAKIGNVKAKRDKAGGAWTLVFTATCAPVNEHHLAQIVECYQKLRYCTFELAEPGLFDDIEQAARKASPAAKPVRSSSGAGATAH